MAQTYSDKPTLAAWNALAGSGAKIAFGTYTGNGTYGKDHPVTLTFDFEPKLLIVQPLNYATFAVTSGTEHQIALLALRGVAQYRLLNNSAAMFMTWEDNSVSWYELNSENRMCNKSGALYLYFAIG